MFGPLYDSREPIDSRIVGCTTVGILRNLTVNALRYTAQVYNTVHCAALH